MRVRMMQNECVGWSLELLDPSHPHLTKKWKYPSTQECLLSEVRPPDNLRMQNFSNYSHRYKSNYEWGTYACWWSNTVTGGRFPQQCGWWGSQCAIPQWRWSGQRQTPSVVKGPCLPQWAKVTTFNFLNAMLTRCHQERWRHCLRSVESQATFFLPGRRF